MKVGARGQITISKELQDQYDLHKGAEVEFIATEDGILMRKRDASPHPVERLHGIAKLQFADSVDEYIEEIRGR